MAEAIGVLGLIASIATIAEAAYEIYEAASDSQGLPKKLQPIAEQIPLMLKVLQLADENVQSHQTDKELLHAVRPILQRCEKRVIDVRSMFEKIIPAADASRADRMKKAVGLRTKINKAKESMEEIMKDTELLANHQSFCDALVLQDIQNAVEQLSNLPKDEGRPQLTHSGAGSIHTNHGAGVQHNYTNTASGNLYSANSQTFGRDRVMNQYHIQNYHGPGIAVVESEEDLDRDILASLAFPQMLERRSNVDRAHHGTCQWIYNLTEYQNWCSQASGLLWIKGNPGVGKSTVMSQLYDNLYAQRDPKHVVYLDFFFSARGAELQHTPLGMFRSLLNQIFDQNENIRDAVRNSYRDKMGRFGGKQPQVEQSWQWQQRELEDLLTRALTESATRKSVVLFIDALDEAGQAASSLAKYFHQINDRARALSLPIKICISCRHYPISSTSPGAEIHAEEHNREDMRNFVQSCLKNYEPSADDDAEFQKLWHLLIRDLVDRAHGVFQWARLVLPRIEADLAEGEPLEEVRQKLYQVPEKLEDVYDDILRTKIRAEYRVQSTLLFQWTLLARRPLSVVEIYTAVTASQNVTSTGNRAAATDKQMRARIIAWSGGLASIVEPAEASVTDASEDSEWGPDWKAFCDWDTRDAGQPFVQVIHQSVDDFLHAKGLGILADSQDDADSTMIDLERCHANLYWTCLRYLSPCYAKHAGVVLSAEPSKYALVAGYRDALPEYPFLKYVSRWVLDHGRKAGACRIQDLEEETELLDRLAFFQYPDVESLEYRPFRCALDIAAYENRVDLVHYILGRDEYINTLTRLSGTPIIFAAAADHVSMVELLMKHGVDVNAKDKNGIPALYEAVGTHDMVLLRLLLKCGADVNARTNRGRSALHQAQQGSPDQLDTLQLLLEHGADINAQDNDGRPVLHHAVLLDTANKVDAVQLLLQHGTDVNIQDNEGRTALQHALWSRTDSKIIMELLLRHGANVDIQDNQGRTALQGALWSKEDGANIVELLLRYGADVNIRDNEGRTALQHTPWLRADRDKIIELLIQHGADVNVQDNKGQTALHHAPWSKADSEGIVQLLLRHGADVNIQDDAGASVLHSIVSFNHMKDTADMVKLLLQHGANVNARNWVGDTALHYAVWSKEYGKDVVQILLQNGADVDARNRHGESALHQALQQDEVDKDVVQLLLQHGADVNAQEEKGVSALQVASKLGSEPIVRLMINHGTISAIQEEARVALS